MNFIKLFEEFNKVTSLDQVPEHGNFYCGRCGHKQSGKPEYGAECENVKCDLTVGKKVDILSDEDNLPDGYYLNGPQYDSKVSLPVALGTDSPNPPTPPTPPNNYNSNNSKVKMMFASAGNNPPPPPNPPKWVKDTKVWAIDELIELLEKYLRVFAMIYSKVYPQRYKSISTETEIREQLEKLLAKLKTRNILSIKDAIRILFQNLSIKVSEPNAEIWLSSSDGRKWGEQIVKFEQLCLYFL